MSNIRYEPQTCDHFVEKMWDSLMYASSVPHPLMVDHLGLNHMLWCSQSPLGMLNMPVRSETELKPAR